MIEVYKKDGVIPRKRVELYAKQVEAIVSRCIARRIDDGLNSKDFAKYFGDENLEEKEAAYQLAVEYLEALAFVCQLRLQKRDFTLDECEQDVVALWNHDKAALESARELLFRKPIVGLLSSTGDKGFRFSHLTLQEYLAAKCAVRVYSCDLQQLLALLQPFHARWTREVAQFVACMLSAEIFTSLCQLVLENDDTTGALCEMLQDFLKERGSSEHVGKMICSKLQEIRGTVSLIAGLCHPSLELRNGVLSEMKKFGIPSDPFAHADGIVAKLKQIVLIKTEWNTRAAVILSVAQIAQMDYCQMRTDRHGLRQIGTGRHDTLCWVLDMLGSDTQDDTHFALVTSLGICLKGAGNDEEGEDLIMLSSSDEQQLLVYLDRTLNDNYRSVNGSSEALADVKAYSQGLVDWVVNKSLIKTGQWPLRYVLLFCEQTADSVRATHLSRQLLGRVQALSIETFQTEQDDLLKGLSQMLAVIGPDGSTVILPFLEKGKAHQRVILLRVAADLNMQFAHLHLADFARCLLSEAGDDTTDQSLLTNFLEQEYTRHESELEYKSLGVVSSAFCYLQSVIGSAALDDGEPLQVIEKMKDFEMTVADRCRERKQERARGRERDRQRKGVESEQELEDAVRLEQELKESEMKVEQKAEHLSLETLAIAVKTFRPSTLKTPTRHATNPLNLYCAARLWQMSGLIQQHEFDERPPLSDSQSVNAEDAFNDLLALRSPWVAGYGQEDGRWEQAVCNMMQDKVLGLGRLLFSMVLLHVQKTIQVHPDAAMDKLKLLETKLEQWQSSGKTSGGAAQQLEQRFLLKELHVGCRSQQLPMWAGLVSARTRHAASHTEFGSLHTELYCPNLGGDVVWGHLEFVKSPGGNGVFEAQHLACVLNAAVNGSKHDICQILSAAKAKSDAFKGVYTSKQIDGKVVKLSTIQIAASIARCKIDTVNNAENFLSWLVVSSVYVAKFGYWSCFNLKHLHTRLTSMLWGNAGKGDTEINRAARCYGQVGASNQVFKKGRIKCSSHQNRRLHARERTGG